MLTLAFYFLRAQSDPNRLPRAALLDRAQSAPARPGPRHWQRGHDGAGASAADQAWRHSSSTVHERVGTEKGAPQQGVPVPDRTSTMFFHPFVVLMFLQVAAEPYETIAFRIPAREIEDESDDAGYWNWSHWDPDTKQYSFQFMFRIHNQY